MQIKKILVNKNWLPWFGSSWYEPETSRSFGLWDFGKIKVTQSPKTLPLENKIINSYKSDRDCIRMVEVPQAKCCGFEITEKKPFTQFQMR